MRSRKFSAKPRSFTTLTNLKILAKPVLPVACRRTLTALILMKAFGNPLKLNWSDAKTSFQTSSYTLKPFSGRRATP